jgi:hypothetical protein
MPFWEKSLVAASRIRSRGLGETLVVTIGERLLPTERQ